MAASDSSARVASNELAHEVITQMDLKMSDQTTNDSVIYTNIACGEVSVRSWQTVTDAELEELAEKHITNCYFDTLTYARDIEAILKDRNHAR